MTDVDHRAVCVFGKLQIKRTGKSPVKETFEKLTYQPDNFKQYVNEGNSGDFYAQNCAEGMYTSSVRIIEKAINHNIRREKVFNRNAKNSLLTHEKWLKATAKKSTTRMTLTAIRTKRTMN